MGTGQPQELYLVRHGRTVFNAQDRLRGHADPELDEAGRGQAAAVAGALAERGIAAVYSSPLVRATSTAAALADRLDLPVTVDERFCDRDYGQWTGHRRTELVDEFGSVEAAPGIETLDAVRRRARPAMDAIVDAEPVGAVAVVTHDAVITALLTAIDAALDPQVATGSWSLTTRTDGRWVVVTVGHVPT